MTDDEKIQAELDRLTYADYMAELNEQYERDFNALSFEEQRNNSWTQPERDRW